MSMDFTCYLHPGWNPRIRPADPRRDWMDVTPESFAYRCLPLAIANAHGWEILCPMSFEAEWNGGTGTDAITLRLPPGAQGDLAPVSIFGHGVLTFHVFGLFRTPPGWNLWAGGSPNKMKDGIAPLTGVIETDWSPFSFTMNWRFTRPHHPVRFAQDEAICFLFPLQRGVIEQMQPQLVSLDRNPELMEQFMSWSRSRDAFRAEVERNPPKAASEHWQKRYFHGRDMSGETAVDDHQAKLRVKPFAPLGQAAASAKPAPKRAAAVAAPAAAVAKPEINSCPVLSASAPMPGSAELRAARREWLLDVMEQHRALLPGSERIERRAKLGRDEFLERYYAANRPVILIGEMADWPALAKWTPGYLCGVVGDAEVEYQAQRTRNPQFELQKDEHRSRTGFRTFMERIQRPGAGNDGYITAYNSASNAAALAPLHRDLGFPAELLSPDASQPQGMMWVGPAGTFTPLHHDLTNNLIAQVVGRKTLRIVAAADAAKVYNHQHVFSQVGDLDAAQANPGAFPALRGVRIYDVTLAPGEMIFMPIGWWHQVRSLDFSVTLTYTNFRWRNDWHSTFPSG